jgi:hypothetical protein
MPSCYVKYMTAKDIIFKGTGTYNSKFLLRKQYLCGYDINWKIWTGCWTSKRKILFRISITDGGSISHLLVVGECSCVAYNLRGYGREREVQIRGSLPVMYSSRVECYVNVSFRYILAYTCIVSWLQNFCLIQIKDLTVSHAQASSSTDAAS